MAPDVPCLVTVRRTHIFTIYVWYMTYRYPYDVSLPVSDIRHIVTGIWHMTYRYRYMTYDVSLPVYVIWRIATRMTYDVSLPVSDIWRIVIGIWHITYPLYYCQFYYICSTCVSHISLMHILTVYVSHIAPLSTIGGSCGRLIHPLLFPLCLIIAHNAFVSHAI